MPNISLANIKSIVKKALFLLLSSVLELVIGAVLVALALINRFFTVTDNTVFLGTMHTNNLTHVAKALRARGYAVKVVPWMIPEHEVDVIPYDLNLRQRFPTLYSSFIGQYLLQFGLFIWATRHFNVFIMPFQNRLLDRTVWLKHYEIPLLHLAGKKVILNTYGADVATPRLRRRTDLKYSLYDGYIKDPQYRAFNEKAIARNTRRLEKQADCIISAIDHVDYLDRVDHYFHLRCIDTHELTPSFSTSNETFTFVHAPNHRQLKGTDTIIKVIDALNNNGYPCTLKIIENTPHNQLLDVIKHADAVIDQLLLGTYARLAIESMALGKPVFCYLREDLYQYNPIWQYCPIINVDPETLQSHLISFMNLSDIDRQQLGKDSRQYIETFHSLDAIGKRCDAIIKEVIAQ